MAYLAFADFRTATLTEFCAQLALTTTEASDANLTSAIARFSQRLDDYTNDRFESEALTLEMDGEGTAKLILPKRCTAVGTVKTRDDADVLTLQAAAVYRLHSSLYSTGSKRLGEFDWIEVVPDGNGLASVTGSAYVWPRGPRTVQVVGTFGWTTTPGDVKRAVALMVYDHFKPRAEDLRRASAWAIAETRYEIARTLPTGIPEADEVIANYRREGDVAVG